MEQCACGGGRGANGVMMSAWVDVHGCHCRGISRCLAFWKNGGAAIEDHGLPIGWAGFNAGFLTPLGI